MGTPVTNFGKVTVSLGYDASATSIVLSTGHGSRLPSTFPYPLTWWNATDNSDPADDTNKEIIMVTNRAGDTLTITRAAEGTSASTKNTSSKTYKMLLGVTKAMWDSLFTNSLSQSFRGLSLRTHPDSDKVNSQVLLIHADSMVMNDGQEIQNWNTLTADVTVSGAGGIDTGSELASVWYQIFAIYNASITTKKLLLHRAKDYFFDQDATAGEDGQIGCRDVTARTKIGNGFKVATAGLMEFADVKLVKLGTPTGNMWFTIETDSGGAPTGTVLATSDKFDASKISTTAHLIRVPFRTPPALSVSTQYHLVMQGDYTVSNANYLSWRANTTTAAYANGQEETYDGTTWTGVASGDFTFKIYITRNDTALTLPSGYNQYALIGWVYNNAGSNFGKMIAKDRDVFLGRTADCAAGTALASLASTRGLLFINVAIPPVPVSALFHGTSVGAGAYMGLGETHGFDAQTLAGNIVIDNAVLFTGPAAAIPTASGAVNIEYQSVYYGCNGSTMDLYVNQYSW